MQRYLSILLAVGLLAATGRAGEPRLWRSWSTVDGLAETYCSRISVTPDGPAWVRHGAVRAMSVLDGYGARNLPEPRANRQPDWTATARVYALLDGWPWTVAEDSLKEYRDTEWTGHYRAPPGKAMIAAIPIGRRVLVLWTDHVREYDGASKSWRDIMSAREIAIAPFTSMTSCARNEVWLTGEHGLARLNVAGKAMSYTWAEIGGHRQGMRHFGYPLPGRPGELFAQANLGSSDQHAVVRWAGNRLECIYLSAADGLRGWRGPGDRIWILDGASLFQLTSGNKLPVDRTGALSGTIFDVFTEGDNTFWMATSEGLVRYSPPLWREPPGLALDLPVHAMTEDGRGRLWFSATEYLLRLDGSAWTKYRLPPGLQTHLVETQGVIPLADGTLLLKTVRADQSDETLVFDSGRESFREFKHPEGRRIRLIAPRRRGGVWISSEVPGVPGFRLEIYDGASFRRYLETSAEWKGADLRCVVERPDEDLWLGGSAGGVVYRQGRFFNPFEVRLGYPITAFSRWDNFDPAF